MEEISRKTNEIAIAEYIYQLNVARCIKNSKEHNEELVTKVKSFIDTKEEIIKGIIG